MKKTSSQLLCALGLLLLAVRGVGQTPPQMSAHCIDVGQGNATLLEFPCGAVLIDAGGQDDDAVDRLIQYLRTFFARRTDLQNTLQAIYITHPHKDHTYALRRVVQNFTTKRFIENGQDSGSGISQVRWVRANASQSNITMRSVLNSQVFQNGNQQGLTDDTIDPLRCNNCDPEIKILSGQWATNPGWPDDEFKKNHNNHSLVIRVEFGESSFLFTGDLEHHGIESLLEHYTEAGLPAEILDADVYHVGHHGSHNATTTNLLLAVSPAIAIVSAGHWDSGRWTDNPFTTWAYGHPRRVTVDLLARHISGTRNPSIQANLAIGQRNFFPVIVRKKIYCTAWDGNTVIRANLENSFTVFVKK